jgi:deoxyribodipyrimidine photo-lyase
VDNLFQFQYDKFLVTCLYIRQSERFDAQGYFIKTQLEIFNDVSSKYIHDPTKYKDKLQEIYHIEIGKDHQNAHFDV